MIKNNLFYERILKEAQQIGKPINCIERELGYPRNALHNYREGSMPSGNRVIELARYFGVSPEYLFGEEKKEGGVLSPSILFQRFSTSQKYEMLLVCQSWEQSQLEKILKDKLKSSCKK